LSCFNLSALGSESGFFLLGFCLSRLSPFFLFFLLDFASFHLLLEGFQASLSCLTLLLKFFFLACSIIPVHVSKIFPET
jgi:hypothetical protein